MTIDEKLDEFYNSAIDAATKQSEQIMEEYQASLDKILEEHKTDARRKAAVTLQVETKNFMREKNRRLSVEVIQIKRQAGEKVSELTDILFSEVTEKLVNFMKTEEYSSFLVNQINKAKDFSRNAEMTIYINPSDVDKKDFLEKKTGVDLTISATDFLGGIRAVIHSKNILIDNSFITKLAEEKESFTLL